MARSLIRRTLISTNAMASIVLGLSTLHVGAAGQPPADEVHELLIQYQTPASGNPSERWVFRANHGFILSKIAQHYGREVRISDETPARQIEIWQFDKPVSAQDAAKISQDIQAADNAVLHATPNALLSMQGSLAQVR